MSDNPLLNLARQAEKIITTYDEKQITKVEENEKSWVINCSGSCFGLDKSYGVKPKIGDIVRTYPGGLGSQIQGVDINGKEVFFHTRAEMKQRHKEWCEEHDKEKKNKFEKEKNKLDANYNSLPDVFKRRIDKFRKNNPDFRWKYESYEMICCTQAMVLVNTLGTVEKIKEWMELQTPEKGYDIEKQFKMVPDFSRDHSSNTYGFACFLATLYLTEPEGVVKMHGALAPLVGSKEYGCVPKDSAHCETPSPLTEDN